MSKFYIDTKLFVKELSPFIRFRQWKRHQMRKIVDAKEYLRERNIPYEDSLVKKMRLMAERYQFSFDEFFYLHFQEKTIEESLTFISDSERIDFGSYLNKSYNRYIFDDKGETYKRFKPFYKRDLMPIYSATDSAIWGGQIS